MQDLYSFVKEEDEREICRFGNIAARLRREGARQFLLPGSAGGILLILLGALFSVRAERTLITFLYRPISFFGVLLLFSSLIFYAMFYRRAKAAESSSLVLTNKSVVWLSEGSYLKMSLSDISEAHVEKGVRFLRVPFDMSALEGVRLVLFYKGAELTVPNIENAEAAAQKINSLLVDKSM